MKFRIEGDGTLTVLRNNEWTGASCPFVDWIGCGDHCALFGEPENRSDMNVYLELCRKTLRCPTAAFEDLRGQNNKAETTE